MSEVDAKKAAEFIQNCRDPFFFVEAMWGLTPQPCYRQYTEVLKNTEPENWKAEWFGENLGDDKWKWYDFQKGKHITWQQCAILEGVRRAVVGYGGVTNKIAVKSGNGIGKSCVSAWLVPWFLFAFYQAQVPCTAPTASQMNDVLWKEIGLWINKMPDVYKEIFDWTANYIRITEEPEVWFARARTSRKENPEAFSGVHAPSVMAVADEACFDEETEILTDDGFKFFKDLSKNDKVLSRNNNGNSEFVKPTKIHRYKGQREMYVYNSRTSSFAVTHNHKMLYKTPKVPEYRLKEISELDSSGNVYFPRKVNFKPSVVTEFIVPEYKGQRKTFPEIRFCMQDWASFVGWYLSEGCINEYNYVNITQNKKANPEKCKEIEDLLERMGLEYKFYNGKDYMINYQQIGVELSKYGKGFKNKFIPKYLKRSEHADIFLESFCKGDGYRRGNRRIFYTSSKRMADDIQEMLYLSGSAGTLKKRKKEAKKWHKDHFIESKHDSYVINERIPDHIKFKKENLKTMTHGGYVYCVTTKHGTVFTRRNGTCMWSGNSGVPDIIFEYGKGIATAPFWIFLMFSNPTRLVGHFRNAFKDTSDWRQYTFRSAESPVVDPKFIEEKKKDSGYDSDDYRIFVQGEFPKADSMDDGGFVPLFTQADLENAMSPDDNPPLKIQGVDPSGEGHDKSAFVGRNAYVAKILAEEQVSTPKSVAARAATFIAEHSIEKRKTVIDNFGSGANVAQELALQGLEVTPINVGNKPSDPKFLNLRAELAWKMREWIKKGGTLVRDDRWMELLNLRYRYNQSGKLQIMSKEKMRKDGIASPNFADAFMLTFAVPDMPYRKGKRSAPRTYDDIYD